MIKNLELKLSGELPIDRLELIELLKPYHKYRLNEDLQYDLSNLDISKITNLSCLFSESVYNGDLSKWNTSNVEDMYCMFGSSKFNNDSLKNWNLKNCKNIDSMFSHSEFNCDLSNWNI